MSLDLYQKEIGEDLSQRGMVKELPASMFDNFTYGTGMAIARTAAETGRAASMAGAAIPVLSDKLFGTDYADSYFKAHDEIFQNAVDYWTPQRNEVGAAGELVGQLIGTLGLVAVAPSLAVAKTQLSTTEDLARKGVEPGKAIGVGAVQGGGLGLGIWMPVLGKTLAQRALVGGAGFNALQGVATRGVSESILKGTAAEEDFSAFNWKDLTLDTMLGAAFGGIAHLSKSQRAQGAAAWDRLSEWGQSLKPSDVDAIQTLRQAQHINVDSVGGTPDGPIDTDSHVQRVRRAIDQLAKDEPVNVTDLPEPKINPDGRFVEAEARVKELLGEADRIRTEDDLPAAKRVEEMTPDEMRVELFRDPLTGIKNRRAFDESSAPLRGTIDADGLKWVNDNLGHEAGDSLLKAIAKKLGEETQDAFRVGGDEFAITAKSVDEAERILKSASDKLEKAVITAQLPDGSIVQKKGITFSYGIGKTTAEAETGLQAHKAERERTGVRPARGSEPPGVTRRLAGWEQIEERRVPGREAGKQTDPVVGEAQRLIAENPDVTLIVGQDANGEAVRMSARDYLARESAAVDIAVKDSSLFELAATCMSGRS